jgi:DNA-binding SARP family transcriptional activator
VLNNLSSLLPHSFVASRDSVGLEPDRFDLDLDSFQASSTQASPQSLAAAAALYRDEFMAGVSLDGCPEFEMWLVAERERWHQRIVGVLDRLCEYWTLRGEYAQAMPFAMRLLEIAPWREESHCLMMQLLARRGERSAALQQYETARRVLRQELGVEPSMATRALYQQIRDDAFASTRRPPRRTLRPRALSSFKERRIGPQGGLELEDAEMLLDSSLARFQQSGDWYGLGFSLIVLALTIKQRGLSAQARGYFAEGLEILKERDATSHLPVILGQVGRILL